MKKDNVYEIILEILSTKIVDTTFNIPYLVGYSKDGMKIYTDKDLPYFYKEYPIYRLLLIHAYTEKREIDKGCHYLTAHQKALTLEKMCCTALGLQWTEYEMFLKKYIKTASHNRLENLPYDLDFTAYRDEVDFLELKRRFPDKTYN